MATAKERFIAAIESKQEPHVFDVGAGKGEFVRIAAELGAWVLAFEPQEYLAQRLSDMAEEEGWEHVHIVQAALMDRQGVQELKIPPLVDWGLATVGTPLRFEPVDSYFVPAWTLDDYLETHTVDIIKIDVEGAELMVLQGGVRLLERDKPDILLEYWPQNTAQFGYDVSQLDVFLRRVGYRSLEHVRPYDMWATWR